MFGHRTLAEPARAKTGDLQHDPRCAAAALKSPPSDTLRAKLADGRAGGLRLDRGGSGGRTSIGHGPRELPGIDLLVLVFVAQAKTLCEFRVPAASASLMVPSLSVSSLPNAAFPGSFRDGVVWLLE